MRGCGSPLLQLTSPVSVTPFSRRLNNEEADSTPGRRRSRRGRHPRHQLAARRRTGEAAPRGRTAGEDPPGRSDQARSGRSRHDPRRQPEPDDRLETGPERRAGEGRRHDRENRLRGEAEGSQRGGEEGVGVSREGPAGRRRVEPGRRLAHRPQRKWRAHRRSEGRRPVGRRQHLLRAAGASARGKHRDRGRVQGEREEGAGVRDRARREGRQGLALRHRREKHAAPEQDRAVRRYLPRESRTGRVPRESRRPGEEAHRGAGKDDDQDRPAPDGRRRVHRQRRLGADAVDGHRQQEHRAGQGARRNSR